MTKNQIALANKIEQKIRIIRGQRVMTDFDLAELYGVDTRTLNQAVKRNLARFPSDFSYLLTPEEFKILMSQIVISNSGGRRKLPRVFTEQGVAMLSSVSNSPLAIKVNIEIMRVFVQLRRLLGWHTLTNGKGVACLRDSRFNFMMRGVANRSKILLGMTAF